MKQPAKKITLGILVGTWVMGCVMSFFNPQIMDNFTKFLTSYGLLYIPLIGSIAVNSYKEKQNENKPNP